MDCRIPSSILSQALAVKAEEKRARMEARESPVWVYVVCWRERGPCKIGVAQDIALRRVELQIGNPFELAIYSGAGMDCTLTAYAVEAEIKRRFKGRALMGEWFNVTAPELAAGVRQVVNSKGLELIEYRGPRTVSGLLRKRKARDKRTERARRAMAEYAKVNEV